MRLKCSIPCALITKSLVSVIYFATQINYVITITKKDTKMYKVMARRPKGNYKGYVN